MKLGVYQCIAAGRTTHERLEVLESHIAGKSLDLLVCPELFLSGYNVGEHLPRLAETPQGPFAHKIAALAQKYGTAIAYGYPEAADGLLYNSAALFDAGGTLLANHRKRLPSPHSYEVTTFAKGTSLTFADVAGLRLAIIICYEVEFPESLRQAAQGGAQLVIVPTALGRDWGVVAERVVPARAYENGIWLAYAGHAGEENGVAYYGGSRIVTPIGKDAATAGDQECLITADIDAAAVISAQARIPFLRDCQEL